MTTAGMAKLSIAYVLWLFFGIFGVHHFYLKRDRQAFVWWSTLGGLFGLGWIRDCWCLPEYVKQANEDEKGYYNDSNRLTTRDNNDSAKRESKPESSGARLFGMMAMGYILGYLVMFAVPQPVFQYGGIIFVKVFFLVVPPFAVAVGVHLVANIGRIQTSFMRCLIGSGLGVVWQQVDMLWNFNLDVVWKLDVFWLQLDEPTNIGRSCLLSAGTVCYWGLSRKSFRRPRKGKCKRMSTLFACGAVYLLLWGSSLYYNTNITTNVGENVPLRETIHKLLNSSPAWKETNETLYTLWLRIKVIFEGVLIDDMDAIDLKETNPYKVLGLSSAASDGSIKARYRQLVRKWHPDKHYKYPGRRAKAEKIFKLIQEAYDSLSSTQKRRSQNKYSRQHDEF